MSDVAAKTNGREWFIAILAILLAVSTGFNIRCYYLNGHRLTVIEQACAGAD